VWMRGPAGATSYRYVGAKANADDDGWETLGDIGRLDADGFLYLSDRDTDMILVGGSNVYPAEVEAALSDCEGVAEVAVIGVPDAKWGEVGKAFVVARAGHRLTAEAVVAHARSRLAGYKVPRSVVVMEALPRLGSGKVDRAALARETGS
jgi:acyl-CoA synthetase (AMP-forming)/AMP-acid ligase II